MADWEDQVDEAVDAIRHRLDDVIHARGQNISAALARHDDAVIKLANMARARKFGAGGKQKDDKWVAAVAIVGLLVMGAMVVAGILAQ